MPNLITILTRGPAPDEHHVVLSLFSEETTFFEACGQLEIVKLTVLSDELHSDVKQTEMHKDQCLYTYLFGTIYEKLQNRSSQNTYSHEHQGVLALKVLVDRVT